MTDRVTQILESKERCIVFSDNMIEPSKDYIIETCKSLGISTFEEVQIVKSYCLNNKIFVWDGYNKDGSRKLKPVSSEAIFKESIGMTVDIAKELGIKQPKPIVIPSEYVEELKRKRNPNPAVFARTVQAMMPRLKYTNVIQNLNNMVRGMNALWSRILNSKSPIQSCLYLYSSKGKTGKGEFAKMANAWAIKHGAKSGFTNIPNNNFVGSEFGKNLLVSDTEVTRESVGDFSLLNKIIDGDEYVMEKKGMDRVSRPVTCFLILCSNFLPQDTNSRRINESLIIFSDIEFEVTRDNDNKEYIDNGIVLKKKDDAIDYDYYADLFETLLLSCPEYKYRYNKYSYLTPVENSIFETAMESEPTKVSTLQAIAVYLDALENKTGKTVKCCSPQFLFERFNQLIKEYPQNGYFTDKGVQCYINQDDYDSVPFKDIVDKSGKRKINDVLVTLRSKGLIKVAQEKSNSYAVMYDLTNLAENAKQIVEGLSVQESSAVDDFDPLLMEKKIIDAICAEIEKEMAQTATPSSPVTPSSDPTKDKEEKAIDSDADWIEVELKRVTYSDKFSTNPHFNKSSDPYMLNGRFKDEYKKHCIESGKEEKISRRAENVVPEYFVFECDTKSLEEQLDFINSWNEELRQYIKCITFSGNKSYHVLFSIKTPEDITSSEYKELWTSFMTKNKLIDYADTQCGSLVRLTRNPNGVREDGTVQKCIYFNKDNKAIDLTDDLNYMRKKRKEAEEFDAKWNSLINGYSNRYNNDNYMKEKRPVEEVLENIKKDCCAKQGWEMIKNNDFPSGTDFLAPARGMFNILCDHGYTEDEATEWIRNNYLLKVAEAHPSNVSVSSAKRWTAPKRD